MRRRFGLTVAVAAGLVAAGVPVFRLMLAGLLVTAAGGLVAGLMWLGTRPCTRRPAGRPQSRIRLADSCRPAVPRLEHDPAGWDDLPPVRSADLEYDLFRPCAPAASDNRPAVTGPDPAWAEFASTHEFTEEQP